MWLFNNFYSISYRRVQKRKERDKLFRDWRERENIGNSATVSRTTLQCCIAAYKICKYTVQFLLRVKLLETRILRIVPDVNERVTACLVLEHCVRC